MARNLGETDRRALTVGAVVGAAVTVAAATVAVAALDGHWVRTVVYASPVVGLLAGAVAVSASRERMQPFREGAFAAVAGLLAGMGVWMVAASMAVFPHPVDAVLVLSPFGFVAAFIAFPVGFFVGGAAGHATLLYGV